MSLRRKIEVYRPLLLAPRRRLNCRVLPSLAEEAGASLVEFAFIMPVAFVILTFLLSAGAYINDNLELTNATSLSGQYLAASRSTTAASDPCNVVYSAFEQVSPSLLASGLTFQLKFSGNSVPYSGTTCTGGASYMTQGATAQLTVNYPCSLLSFKVNYDLACTLTSQVTEIIQ